MQPRDVIGGDPGAHRSRAQANVIGYVLIIGIVLAGTITVVALGSPALGAIQTQSELERAEQSMTLFNSRASMVALGDSPVQEISFGHDRGSFETREDESWLRITHTNYTGNGHDELVYNESLGTVVYQNDGTEIAYQGGGVWRNDTDGDAVMVSPPEFHYRGATLTLPIIRTHPTGDHTSGTTVEITRASETKRIFPNATTTGAPNVGAPYNETGWGAYRNPVGNGTINITVKTPYYSGWAEYFRTNTDGQVTTFPDDNQVRVSLVSLTGIGAFDMPNEGNSLDVRGMSDDHPITSFEMTLKPDPHYNNMHWSFYADEGSEEFELHFYSDGKCNGNPATYNGDIDVSIYYYNSSGAGTIHEEWQNQSVNVANNPDFTIDCDTEELTMDLLGSTTMTYGDIVLTGSDNKWEYGPEISSRSISGDTTSFDAHTSQDYKQYSVAEDEELGFLVNHYLQLLGPEYDLVVTDGPGGSSRIDESASTGTLEYDATGSRYITYLHVTENRINVTFR